MYTKNEEELLALGERLGNLLKKNDVLILTGELGAGKTTLTRKATSQAGAVQALPSAYKIMLN